jgi:hypothetical protein
LPWAIFAGAVAYHASGLTARELSLLESQDLAIASDLFRTLHLSADHSALHFVFMNFWERLNQTSVAFIRFPSVVFCALGAVAVFGVARLMGGRRAAWLAAAFFATNPVVVDDARSTRMYSLSLLLVASSTWFAALYLGQRRRPAHLVGFVASSVLAIYNHLFAWLPIGSLCILFVLEFGLRRSGPPPGKGLLKAAALGFVLLLPKIIHIFTAIAFTRGRHALYPGLSHHWYAFLLPIVETLFFGGEDVPAHPFPSWVLAVPIALLVWGIVSWRRVGWLCAAALLLPSLGVAWALSFSNPVLPRYLNTLTIPLAVFLGVGLARIRRVWIWAPLGLAVVGLAVGASHSEYSGPAAAWPEAVARVRSLRAPGDVVAVFPAYWKTTLLRYGGSPETAPFTQAEELERILARGRRVLILRNSGRYFGNVAAFLQRHTKAQEVYQSPGRDPVAVIVVEPLPRRTLSLPTTADASIVLAGVIGSGGYPWQATPGANHPLSALAPLFQSSPLSMVAYMPYRPPPLRWILPDGSAPQLFLPNPIVIERMKEAGIRSALITAGGEPAEEAARLFKAQGLDRVQAASAESDPPLVVHSVHDTRLGILALAPELFGRLGRSTDGELSGLISRAKSRVGEQGRLVLILPNLPDYGRLPDSLEQQIGRRAIELGVDVVAGMGGYAAKPVEEYQQGIIAYGLGSLLRPDTMSLASVDATGIALRVSFPKGRKPAYQVVPIGFDDQSRAVLDDPRRLSVRTADAKAALSSLTALLEKAEARGVSHGQEEQLGPWQPQKSAFLSGFEQWLQARAAPLWEYYPAGWNAMLRPFFGGYARRSARVALRGVVSMGEPRRAIEMDPGGYESVSARWQQVRLGSSLEFAYALPDDRVAKKNMPLNPQTISLWLGEELVHEGSLPYVAGWHFVSIDTRQSLGLTRDVKVVVAANGTHFPIAVDLETR